MSEPRRFRSSTYRDATDLEACQVTGIKRQLGIRICKLSHNLFSTLHFILASIPIMSSDLQSTLELLQTNDYTSGMAAHASDR